MRLLVVYTHELRDVVSLSSSRSAPEITSGRDSPCTVLGWVTQRGERGWLDVNVRSGRTSQSIEPPFLRGHAGIFTSPDGWLSRV